MFSSAKIAVFWILFVAGIGLGIFKGKGMRLAVWIPQSRKQMSWQGSAVRWAVVPATVDVVMIGVGSFMEIVGLYILGRKVGGE